MAVASQVMERALRSPAVDSLREKLRIAEQLRESRLDSVNRGSTTTPAEPTTSGRAPRLETTTGAPQAMASRRHKPEAFVDARQAECVPLRP